MLPCSEEASLSLDRLEKASAILQTIDNLQKLKCTFLSAEQFADTQAKKRPYFISLVCKRNVTFRFLISFHCRIGKWTPVFYILAKPSHYCLFGVEWFSVHSILWKEFCVNSRICSWRVRTSTETWLPEVQDPAPKDLEQHWTIMLNI